MLLFRLWYSILGFNTFCASDGGLYALKSVAFWFPLEGFGCGNMSFDFYRNLSSSLRFEPFLLLKIWKFSS
uniref:Uncharacterized protein n=1 Tax=Rhizophora mucronata TaxID=61149 RepID=A0A2P2QRT5_RHIMU